VNEAVALLSAVFEYKLVWLFHACTNAPEGLGRQIPEGNAQKLFKDSVVVCGSHSAQSSMT
jgi:hypothetical protein